MMHEIISPCQHANTAIDWSFIELLYELSALQCCLSKLAEQQPQTKQACKLQLCEGRLKRQFTPPKLKGVV